MLIDAAVAMLVVHVDDIKIAATEEVTDSVVSDLNRRFLTKHLGEVVEGVRLMLIDAAVAMLVVHVDDIKIAATEEVTDSVYLISIGDFLQNIWARLRGT